MQVSASTSWTSVSVNLILDGNHPFPLPHQSLGSIIRQGSSANVQGLDGSRFQPPTFPRLEKAFGVILVNLPCDV